jgi:protein TonB
LFGTLTLAAAIVAVTFGAKSATAQSDEPVPLVRVAAVYPSRELLQGLSGDVTLRFAIDVDGRTKDIEVVESSSGAFERPAVKALSKWRYVPQTANGTPVEKRDVQTVIRFDRYGGG